MHIFEKKADPGKGIITVALFAFLSFAVYIGFFFYDVNSTLTDYTWGDVALYNQFAYNFTHGRPFQSSMLPWGNSIIFVHSFCQHVNFTPYLILWLYKFMPTVDGFYIITIFFNVAGFLGMGWLIARQIFPRGYKFIPYVLVCTVLFCIMPFAKTVIYKGLFPLLAGPFTLALYYFFLRKRILWMLITELLLIGVSEDMAMFMLSFSLYFFLFEKGSRKTAVWMGMIALAYLVLVLLIIQPAAMVGLTYLKCSSFSAFYVHNILKGQFVSQEGVRGIVKYLVFLVGSLAVIRLFLGFENKIEWKKLLGLIFVAPASHWLIVFFEGSGHHVIQLLSCTFLAFLLLAANSRPKAVPVGNMALAAALCVIFVVNSFWIRFSGKLHFMTISSEADLEPMILTQQMFIRPDSIARMRTNKDVLRHINALPVEASICFWTNRGIDAFITSRSVVFLFPQFIDLADYLVIQKDADRTFFAFDAVKADHIEEAIKKGKNYSTGDVVAIPADRVQLIKNYLVDIKRSYEIVTDTQHVLILKRKKSIRLVSPPTTIGFGWVKNIRI
jgi:Predicted membrane protein (DUF2079)